MSWRDTLGVSKKPIKRFHYFLIILLTPITAFIVSIPFVFIDFWLIAMVFIFLALFTNIEATGNRLKDAGLSESNKWMFIIPVLGFFLFLFLLFKPTKANAT